MESAGFERDYGRRIVADLVEVGFTEVRGEGRDRPPRLIDNEIRCGLDTTP